MKTVIMKTFLVSSRAFSRLFASGLMLLVAGTGISWAEIGPWRGTPEGQVRMLTAGPERNEDGRYVAGVEIALQPGWKTYWENPGETGIPTTLDFSGSDNLKEAKTLFPIPERYEDPYGTSLVYHDLVILPLLLTPKDPALPIRIRAQMTYGVCEQVCIPADAALEATVGPDLETDTVSTGMINRTIAELPTAAGPDAPVSITDIAVTKSKEGEPGLAITARLTAEGGTPDLFVVAPEGSYISLPRLAEQTGKEARWDLPLDGLAKTDNNSELRFTLVQGDHAVQHNWQLPKSLGD